MAKSGDLRRQNLAGMLRSPSLSASYRVRLKYRDFIL
jgi:hypothetical protein